MAMINREHGNYVVGKCLQTVLLSARGPWNDETLKRGSQEMREMIESLEDGQPWAQISCLYGESLMPPSTFGFFAAQTKTRKDKGLTALAVVIRDSDIENTIIHQLSHAYQDANIEHKFFGTLEAAIDWLKDKGFALNQAQIFEFFETHRK